MTEAIFGLIGVVIGGLLNGGVSFLVRKRQEKDEARVASRLVQVEIEWNQRNVEGALEAGTWDRIRTSVTTDEWEQHRTVLAAVLKDLEWSSLNAYYTPAQLAVTLAATFEAGNQLGEQKENLQKLFARGVEAIAAIRRYAGDEVLPPHMHPFPEGRDLSKFPGA
jgi:hypothetical protein